MLGRDLQEDAGIVGKGLECRYGQQCTLSIGLGIGFCLGVDPLAWDGLRTRDYVDKLGRSGQ